MKYCLVRYLSIRLHLWTPSSTKFTNLSSINLILRTGVSAKMSKKKNSYLSLISLLMSWEKHWKVYNPTSLLNNTTENGILKSKTKALQGRQIKKWFPNLKESLMNGVTRSKKHLKELTMNKNKVKTADQKMNLITGSKEWENLQVFRSNLEAKTAGLSLMFFLLLPTTLKIILLANQEIKFI